MLKQNISLRDVCEKCGSDLHCCKNCVFYSLSVYNECKETQADRILDKEKANYCDYFKAKTLIHENKTNASKLQDSKQDIYKKLDDLFSK